MTARQQKYQEKRKEEEMETFTLKLGPEVLRRAKKQADKEQRTVASLIRFVLVTYLDSKSLEKLEWRQQ